MINLSPQCRVRLFNLEISDITGTVLHKSQQDAFIETLEIFEHSELPCMCARLLIRDPINFSTKINNETKFALYVEDLYEKYFLRTFEIYEIFSTVTNNNEKLLEIKLMDTVFLKALRQFKRSSFTKTKTTDVLKKFLEEFQGEIDSQMLEVVIEDSEIIHDSIIVPGNRNFLDFIYNKLKDEGMLLYQTKRGIYCKKAESLLPSKQEDFEYKLVDIVKNDYYKGNIIAWDIVSDGNKSVHELSPANVTASWDPTKKSHQVYEKNYSDIYSDMKMGDLDNSGKQNNIGMNLKTSSVLSANGVYMNTFLSFINNVKLRVAIPGDSTIKLFHIIEIDVHEEAVTGKTRNEGSPRYSGKYLVTNITDKFDSSTKYSQLLTLSRSDLQTDY